MSQKTYFALHSLDHPPDHLISLGQIITTPAHPWKRLASPLPIPKEAIATTIKNDWGTEVLRNREHRIGIWAQFAALILGIGADAVVSFSKRDSELFQFDELETSFFEPDVTYVERSVVRNEAVAEWVKKNPRKSVYMVTGLKIARGAAHLRAKKKTIDTEVKPVVDTAPFSGVPVETGVLAGLGRGEKNRLWFSGGSDFVFAYRLRRIIIKRQAVSKSKDYVKGATVAHDEGEVSSTTVPYDMSTPVNAIMTENMDIESVEQSQEDYGSGGYPVDGFDTTVVRDDQDGEECLLQVQEDAPDCI